MELFPFDESYLQRLRNRDFPTGQRFVAYFNKLLLIKLCSRFDSYLWVVTPRRVTLLTLPPARESDSLVQSYGAALVGPRNVLETDNAKGQKLYELLIGPAQSLIRGRTRVTILPDGGR